MESKKIKKLIEDHKALFEVTEMDVAQSLKGEWIFTRYNKADEVYDALIRFETAEELAEIMLGELATDILTSIDRETDGTSKYTSYADDVEFGPTYEDNIRRLIEYLGY